MDNLKELAMLKDGFGYQKDMADLYAKKLKDIWDWLDTAINDIETGVFDGGELFIKQAEMQEIKNSIPESALNR